MIEVVGGLSLACVVMGVFLVVFWVGGVLVLRGSLGLGRMMRITLMAVVAAHIPRRAIVILNRVQYGFAHSGLNRRS